MGLNNFTRLQDIKRCLNSQASAADLSTSAGELRDDLMLEAAEEYQLRSAAWSRAARSQYEYLFPSEDGNSLRNLAKKGFGGRMDLEDNPLLAEIACNTVYWARKDPGGFFTDGERLTPEQLERAYILLLMHVEANFS